ncbi:MAG: DJ-1/PfpI family protein [Candidatus Omnitrophota bacterium]
MEKVVMIISHEGFRDEELLKPKKVLEDSGVKVDIASTDLSPAVGKGGNVVQPDILFNDIDVEDYQAIIFIGGASAACYWDDPRAHKLAQEALAKRKVLAAICIAPVTLANAGVLKGKKATVFSSEVAQIKQAGALYTGLDVERDGNIITASGPHAAEKFGVEIDRAIHGK